MKYKVSELEGALLDAAVALADGQWSAESIKAVAKHPGVWQPSTNWNFGGPIIERERITVGPAAHRPGQWWAGEPRSHKNDGYGHTLLIAAMRAYVSSRFGEEVELP